MCLLIDGIMLLESDDLGNELSGKAICQNKYAQIE